MTCDDEIVEKIDEKRAERHGQRRSGWRLFGKDMKICGVDEVTVRHREVDMYN